MNLWNQIRTWLGHKELPTHLQRGVLGERAARKHLEHLGLRCLVVNYRGGGGEIDLVCRDQECLVFVEVKTRSSEEWTRPAAAVDAKKRRLLSKAALAYLRGLRHPAVKFRFDIVEVLLENDAIREIRHLPNSFELSKPLRYG